MNKEEQEEGAEAQEDDKDGESDKQCRGPECRRRDGSEVIQSSLTQEILTILKQSAGFPQSEVPGAPAAFRISQPLGLDEDDDIDDGIAHGEYPPQDTDCPGVTQMLQLVIMIRG